jgi:hypothetical protein
MDIERCMDIETFMAGCTKGNLCQWVCLALQKALSAHNIKKGFQKTGIWLFNPHIVDDKMGPSKAFFTTNEAQADSNDEDDDEHLHPTDPFIHEVVGVTASNSHPESVQFFMRPCSLKSNLSKTTREYYSGKVLLGKARLTMVYVTKVTCRVKDI